MVLLVTSHSLLPEIWIDGPSPSSGAQIHLSYTPRMGIDVYMLFFA